MALRASMTGDVPVLGPIGVAVTGVSNAAVPAIGQDFLRHGILFHNPNSATVLRIAPTGMTLVSGSGGIALNPFSTFKLFDSDGGLTTDEQSTVRVNCGWQVVADSAGAFGLTIWNFTDSNPAVTRNPAMLAYQNIDPDILSPNGNGYSALTTASAQIIGANPVRRGMLFHNPGTQNKGISPGNIAASVGAGSIVILPKDQLEIRAFGKVRMNCAFNAATANNGDGTLTALEYV